MSLPIKNHLHPMLYIVADKPGKDNLDPAVPLVGTRSYRTLLTWLGSMDVDVTRVRFYNQSDDPFRGYSGQSLNQAIHHNHIRVLALGVKAKNYLLKSNIEEFFALPHPSSRNLVTNDKKYVKTVLEQCRSYIYEEASHIKHKPSLKAVGEDEAPAKQDYKEQAREEILPEG